MNHDARLAWRNRRLDEFIARAGISYIADEERIITKAQRFASTPLMLSELSSYPLRGWPTGRRVLWQVGSGQRRSGPTCSRARIQWPRSQSGQRRRTIAPVSNAVNAIADSHAYRGYSSRTT